MSKIDLQSQLAPEYQSWFEAQLRCGRFPSVEEGLNTIFGWFKHEIDDRIDPAEDLSWVKPLIEEADNDLRAGRVHAMQEVHAEIRRKLYDTSS